MSVDATRGRTVGADGRTGAPARRAVLDVFGLTPMQQGMLFHALSAPDAPLYLQQMVLELDGVADEATLRAGLADLVDRHPTLRTAIVADAPDQPLQAVLAAAELPVTVTDLRGSPVGLADRRAAEALAEHRSHPFDLRRPPLLRVEAIRVADDRWFLATTHHHLVLDGWSVPLLHADLAELLDARRAGRSPQLPPVRGFVEFVRWLRDRPEPDAAGHYGALVGDLRASTGLGVDRVAARSDAGADIDWDRVELTHDTDESGDPQRLCREHGLLPSTLVHAAWGLLLARYTDSRDAVFAMTVSGRPAELPDAGARVGMFVNSVPVRVHVAPDARVGEWLAGVRDQLAASREYEQVPVGQVQRCSRIPLSRPLFETVVAFQNYWRPAQDRISAGAPGSAGVTISVRDRLERTSLPVAVAVSMPARHVWVRVDYDRHRIDRAVAEAMAADYARLIAALAAADPDALVDDVAVPGHAAPPAVATGTDDLLARGTGLLAAELPLTADDRVLAALADTDPLRTPLAALVAAAGAVLELRDPLLPGTPGGATVVVGPPVALAALAPAGVRVAVADAPVRPALFRALAAAGNRVSRLLGAAGVGVVACLPVAGPDDGCGLGRIPDGWLADAAGRPSAVGSAGRLLLGAVDTGIRARVTVSGALTQLGTGAVDRLAALPGVADAAVLPDPAGTGAVGWIVPAGTVDTAELLDALRRTVPAELIPGALHVVPWLPYTATGALDTAALSAVTIAPAEPASEPEPAEPDGPIARRFRALPAAERRALLDALRDADRAAGRIRRHRGGPVPASHAQRDWREAAGPVLRAHNSVPAAAPATDPRVTVVSTSDGDRWCAAPDVLDVAALADLARPADASDELGHDDYAAWQADPRRAPARAADLTHWRTVLRGAPRSGWLPDLVASGTEGVGEVSRTAPGTPGDAAVWLAAVAVALGMLGRDDEAVLAVVTRPDLPDGVGAAGPYARTLPVRLPAEAPDGLGPVVAEAGDRLAQARAHAELAAADLAELWAGPPLVGVAVHDAPGHLAAHAGVTLGLDIAPVADGHRLTAVFDTARMRPETAAALLARVSDLARCAVDRPTAPVRAADLVGAGERATLLDWSAGEVSADAPATLPELVAAVVERRPGHTAVEGPDGLLDYEGLWRRATGLAARLRADGVGTDDRVALCLPRTTAAAWVPLGILLAGAAYVPVDPAYPVDRARFICADAGARLVVTTAALADRFETPTLCVDTEALPPADAPVPVAARPDSAAYVIYTSGSTGTPKGVVVEHRAVTDFCRHIATAYHLGDDTRLLGFAAITFDVSVFDLWAALTVGATLVLAGDEERLSVDRLARLLVERRVTAAELPPSLLPLLDPATLPDLRLVSVGGEAPAGALVDDWAGPDREFWNGYGPTETTVAVTLMRCDPPSGGRVPPIGRPMTNHRAHVLDDALRPVGVGVPGELCVGGAGLARGYLGLPAMTADRFVPDPFSPVPGERLYRTGDLVRWTPDGILEFLGRVDRQVKLRGFRVELGEVEAVLAADERIRQVAVEPWTDPAGTVHLTAYLVADGAVTLADVRAIAAARLPDYMVPTRAAVLDRLPLTATGKLDRAALPEPPAPNTSESTVDSTEWTDDERVVAGEIFAPLLGLAAVGRDDDFFGLGGNSLQATQVTSRVRDRFNVEVSLADMFAEPTVAQVARLIAKARTQAGRHRDAIDSAAAAPPMTTGALLPASYPQEWLWRADRDAGGNPRFNAPFTLRLGGPLDLTALGRAFALLTERHATLRVTFEEHDGALMQRVGPPAAVDLPVVEVPGADLAAREAAVAELVRAEGERTFDLAAGPLLRVRVYRLDPDDHVVQWTIHHVATDGWSIGVQLPEVGGAYHAYQQGTEPDLPPLRADYGEFVDWHRGYVASPAYRDDLAWWTDHLAGAAGPELATDTPRDGHVFAPGYLNLALPPEVATGVRDLTRRTSSTLYMASLAAYAIVLGACGGGPELTVLTPNALRVRQSWEDLVGWFANRVVLRVRLDPDAGFADHLAAVKRDAMAAFAHQYVPFELLREELALPDGLLAACFSVQNAPTRGMGFTGFGLGQVADPGGRDFTPIGEVYAPLGVKYECSVMLRERPGGVIAGGLEYDAGLFGAERATGWRDGFLAVLARATADPAVRVAELLRVASGD